MGSDWQIVKIMVTSVGIFTIISTVILYNIDNKEIDFLKLAKFTASPNVIAM